MRGLAYRRHHMQRLKRKRARQWADWFGDDIDATIIGILARTAPRCSCSGCGNPRRHFGELSVQERKASMGGLVGEGG